MKSSANQEIAPAGDVQLGWTFPSANDTSAMGRHYSKERDKAQRAGKAMKRVIEEREEKLKA